MKVFQVCISIVYNSFFWNLALALVFVLHCYCGDMVKYGLLSKHLFQRKQQHGWFKKSHFNNKLCEKITSASYQVEQKTFIEASCIYSIHTGEKHFCSCYFWRFVSRLDSDRLKKCEVYFGLYESSLTFIEAKRPIKYCLCEVDVGI